MKIGIFTDTYLPDINGVVSSIVTLQKELEKHGHDVVVITNHPKILKTEYDGNVIRLPGIELKQLYGYVMSSPIHLKIMEEVEKMELDVIHVHTEFGIGILGRTIAKKLKLPLISTYHTTYEDYTHYINIFNMSSVEKIAKKTVANISKLYGEKSTALISPSLKTKEMLERYGIKTRIYIIPTGLDLKKFNRQNTSEEKIKALRLQLNVKEDETLITFVGRVAKEKSIDIVIDAFHYLKEEKKCKLMIVGGGPDLEALKEKAQEYNLNDQVIFTGKVPSDQVPIYYFASDAFVSASLTETQGMTYIEALASGIPVFARPDEVLLDLVFEGKTGYYFKDAQDLASKIKLFSTLSHQDKESMREVALKTAQEYDSELFYDKVIQVYKDSVATFKEIYKITNIKYKNDAVELTLENPTDEMKTIVSVDTFVKEGLRRDSEITQIVVERLLKEEEVMQAYSDCIKKITFKDRTRKEMYDWLTKNTELEIDKINIIIERLEEKGYINDERYVQSQIMNLKALLQGKNKIMRDLVKKGIPQEMVDIAFANETDSEELILCIRYAEKVQPSIKDHSLRYKKNALRQKLYNQGYDTHIIEETLSRLSYVEEEKQEQDVLRKVANRAYNRYHHKYKGSKLRNTVFRYLSSQGFEYEDIYLVLNEMEWENE